MAPFPSIEALRTALAPVEALRGEQSQLESWVFESFTALDALHDELSDWQRDLTRQQAALDQREAALTDAEGGGEGLAELQHQLATAQEETRQLEEESTEQLQTLEDLERKLVISHAELRTARQHSDELNRTLQTERQRATDEHRHWTGELQEMRRLLAQQADMLAKFTGREDGAAADGPVPLACAAPAGEDEQASDTTARAAEFRRRAQSRRAAHRREA